MSPQATAHIIELSYICAVVLFVLSLKWLSAPSTARRGVLAGEVGMALAIAATLLYHGIVSYQWIAVALVVGCVVGIPLGLVPMTAVPQRTALSHAFGALAAAMVGTAEYLPGHAEHFPFHDVGAGDRSHPGLAHFHREPDGGGQAAGGAAAKADHVQGPEPRQPVAVGRRDPGRGLPGPSSGRDLPLPGHRGDPAACSGS